MSEALFYHLERRSLEDVLPGLLEKSLARGWRALVKTDSAERAEALDDLLWTYDDESFLAHAQAGDGDAARQPVFISTLDDNPNGAQILFCAATGPDDWASAQLSTLARVVMLFDGRDPALLDQARTAWKNAKAAGHDVTYWKESPSGKFEKQA